MSESAAEPLSAPPGAANRAEGTRARTGRRPPLGFGRRPRGPRARSSLLTMRSEIPAWQFALLAAGMFAAVFIAWIVATSLNLVQPLFLPTPGHVVSRLVEAAKDGVLFRDMGASVWRIFVGFVIASAMALPLGVLIGTYRSWEAAFEPLVDFIRYMPVVAFVPLTIIWVGTSDTQKFTIIWIGTFFQQVLMIMDNVKRVPLDFIDVGRTLGMRDRRIISRIIVRSSAPAIWDTLRITLGWAWTYVTLAEIVAANSGLGYRITVGQRFFQTDLIIGYIIVLGILGLTTDQLMKFAGRRMFRWAEARR